MWQTVERKARFIAQVMRGRLDIREIEDIGDAALSYNEVKALATGNPLLMDKAEADADLTRLQRAERAHHRNQDTLRYKMASAEKRIAAMTALAADIDTAIGGRTQTRGELFTMTIDGIRYDKRREAGERLRQLIQRQETALTGSQRRAQASAGQLGGFGVTTAVDRVLGSVQITLALDGAPGTDMRMTVQDLAAADPAGLVVRLENRLSGMEALKTKTMDEIDRLEAEAGRARADIGKPFSQADQLEAARNRVREIEERLEEAARPPQRDEQREASGINGTALTGAVGTGFGLDHVAGASPAPAGRTCGAAAGSRHDQVSITQRSFPGHYLIADRAEHGAAVGPVPVEQRSPSVRPSR